MEKSCENCRYAPRTHGCISGITCIDFSQHKPDYPTLERENAELKQQVEKLQNEKSAFELLYHTTERHFVGDTVKSQNRIAELTQALERACELVVTGCPIEKDCRNDDSRACGGRKCKAALVKHFKEGMG